MMIVYVSQMMIQNNERGELQDALDVRWHAFFLECGITPVITPNCIRHVKNMLDVLRPQGFLLTGGADHPEREQVETYLLEYALQHHLPILGVCHGMQVIQRYFGNTLEPIEGHVCAKQRIVINKHRRTVNSYHRMGTKTTTPELLVWAKAEDGIVKAVSHKMHSVHGIMWHPERLMPFAKEDLTYIINLFRETA